MTLLLAAGSVHGLLVLLIYVIIAVVALGLLWFVTTRVAAEFGLPSWVPLVILAVVVIIILLWLTGQA